MDRPPGAAFLHVRDPMALVESTVLVPQPFAPLLALCDGTRDLETLRTGLALRTGVHLSSSQVADFVAQLETALLFETAPFK